MLCAGCKISDFSFLFFNAAKKLLINLAVISLIFEQFLFVFSSTALAAELPITPDGTTNTQIDAAANGVVIVNIAAPNAGGLSHNKFNDYNVNQSGLILNNAIGSQNGVIQTQIGGLINDNANLANSGAASVILNEVTSNNISQINGYTEIAGRSADLILANPNGFVMNGAGFINVSRFSAVVGSANQFNPRPNDLTFSLSGNAYEVTHGFLPKLTIMGSGIDLENITSTDLVANVMNIVAPIYGGVNDVNLRTGDQTFNYFTKEVTSDNENLGSNMADEVAIDASALGKIQAGRIFIIATKEGFGIKYSGDLLASRAGVVIDNQGNIDYNNIASEAGDIEVISHKGSIAQRGISQTKDSGSDIIVNAFGNITNSGQFVSARNINIDSGATFRNESAALNLSDNDFTVTAVDFANLGQIAANRDLNIEATTLTNSAKLVGGRNLTLSASQITNDDSIYAGNKITINAANYLTNNKEIISLGTATGDGVIINAKTLNNNKQIAAKKDVTINSNVLNNNTANSLILGLNNVNLNAVTIDNSNANIQAAGNLTLRNLVLNAPDVASLFSITNQATSITNIGGNFYATNLLDFDLGNADYTILGNLQSAGDIKIKAVNITNQTNLEGNGAIEIIATDKFTNGSLLGDNSNNKIIGGTNLSITATNLLSNYGTLSSSNNLTLTSTLGNINNNVNAEIIGGSGTLALLAKNGAVNQNSLHSLVANGDLALDATDFDNAGRVDIAGNFTLNVANNLINEAGALIYSGGNIELNVVNNLTNNSGAVIYSEGNLTIQKYALTSPSYNEANNKSNLVKNISGQIISYGGNMRIDAANISNERAINPFNLVLDPQTGGTISQPQSADVDQYSWQLNNDGCFGHECENRYRGYYARQLTNSGSIAGVIQSGGTLTVNAGTLDNLASNISAVGNITINADTLNNHSINDPGLYYMVTTWGNRDVYSLGTTTYIRHDPGNGGHSGSRLNYNDFAQNNPSTIKSGGSITLNVASNVSNATTNSNASTGAIATQTPQLINALSVEEVATNGVINIDLRNYFSGPDSKGLFQKSTNPNGPLFETRSEFLDQSRFFGSNYFYQRIGLDLGDVQTQFELQNSRLVGDQFFQTKIIEEQLRTITKNSFLLSSGENNVNNEIKSLLDNAADEYVRLGLATNNALTQTQINNLQKDIVWFETQTIDGAVYIVPKIYLTQATRDSLKNGNMTTSATMYAAGDININSASGKITNAGSISGNNVALTSSGDILNKNFSNIAAIGALSLTSSAGSITNVSQISAGGALSLTAAKDVTNSSTVLTNDSGLLDSGISGYVSNGMASSNTGFIQSKTLETAGITAGSLNINAGNDFNSLAANIATTENADITAGNNANFSTLGLRDRTETSWGHASRGGSRVVDTTTNVASNVNVGGNLDVRSTGLSDNATTASINIIGSNITVAGNGSLTSDFGNINIVNAVDSKMTEETSYKSGSFHSRYDSVYDYRETAAESKLNFGGDLTVNAELGNVNLIGSTLQTEGDLNFGNFTVAQNLDGSYKTNADGTFETIDGGSVAGVNIKAAELRSEHREVHQKSELSFGDLFNLNNAVKQGLEVAKFMITPVFKKDTLAINNGPKYEKSSAESNTATITQHSSTLNVGGNMMVNSSGDVNIVASDVNVAGNALMNVDGNVNVLSAAEKATSSNKTEEIEIGTLKITKDLAHASGSVGVEGTGSKFEDSLTSSTQKSSNINIGGSFLANVTNNNDDLNSGNLTLAASNLTVGGDSIIKTAGDFNLTDAQDTSSYSSKESILTVEMGVKVGNAYVDAAYAWKAVLDAEKKVIKAAEKLKKMEKLKDEGKASQKAVDLAIAQLALAQVAVLTATIAAAAATAGAASAASSSMGTGMYGAGYLNTTSSGIKNTTETSLSRGSSFVGYGDIDIASGNDLNILGSMLASVNGDVALGAANNIKIEAGTNTVSQKSRQETIYGGGSVGNNGVQLNIGLSQGESEYDKTFYTNSQVSAENGTLTLTTGNDANISGANLLAKNVDLNVGNNLNIESKQTEEDFSSSGFGFNFGVGVGAGGGGNVSAGFNMSNADMHRLWLDDITTIKGTDSMSVNVGQDLNLKGAAILSDNLVLAVSGNINKRELHDSYYSESMSIGVSTSVSVGGNQPTIPGTGAKPNQAPGGSTSISGSYAQNESNRTVYATIGGLDSALTSGTKTMIGGDFEGGLTVDFRLLSEGGRKQIGRELNYSKNLATTPFSAAYASYNSNEENKFANFLNATAGATVANTRLFLNQEITAQELAGDTTLVSYDGRNLDSDSPARDRNAFYDENNNTVAINTSNTYNMSTEEVAGKIAHEAIGHKVGGESEFVAEFVEEATKSNWGDYQDGNTKFQLTLPQANVLSNNYASSLSFESGSGVYSDVAFKLIPNGAGGYGHIVGYLQDGSPQWHNFEKFISNEDRGEMTFIAGITDRNFGSIITMDEVPGDQQAFKEQLINDPNVVYIRTTVEQDKKIANAAALRYLHPDSYSLCSKNCLDAVQEIFSAGNVKLPIDFYPGPKSYFNNKLKPYYPDNKTNQSYDQ